MRLAAERAVDDPAKLARAARVVRAAIARGVLSAVDLGNEVDPGSGPQMSRRNNNYGDNPDATITAVVTGKGVTPTGLYLGPVVDGVQTYYGPALAAPEDWEGRDWAAQEDSWRPVRVIPSGLVVQCRPVRESNRWVIQVTVPSDVPDRDALFNAVADAATEWEPEDRDGWDIDVSAGPEADMRKADQ
jgi:hypothetical protein